MTGLIWRAVTVALATVALALLAMQVIPRPVVPPLVVSGVCVLLIVIAALDWWAVSVVRGALRRSPDVTALRDQLERFALTAAGCSSVAVVGLNYLVGSLLPKGAGFLLLAVGLLLVSVPPVVFLYRYYRNGD